MNDMSEAPVATRVEIPYVPRAHFKPMHASKKRFKFVVAHRRAGKSVSEINEVIKKALNNKRKYPPPRYAYVGPSFAQTKDLIWGYAKHYTAPLPNVGVSEGDLQLTLPNGAMINLYGGAAAYERMRGLYFDGIVLDEFPLLNPSVFSTVVRPCLADYRGWAIVSGTSNGDDHFHELKKRADVDDSWDVFVIPVTETDALHPDEVAEMTSDMTPEEYAREMLCSFEAPIEGAYFADLLNQAQSEGRITGVPHDPNAPVYTWWDLGIDDSTAIWFFQLVGKEVHFIDYIEDSGKPLPYYAQRINEKPYNYGAHIPPHDVEARELGTGKTRKEVLQSLLTAPIITAPMAKVEDTIAAARSVIPMAWFDKAKCQKGLMALRNWHRSKKGKPVHNWASHGADAFRTGSMAMNLISVASSWGPNIVPMMGKLKRRIRGVM